MASTQQSGTVVSLGLQQSIQNLGEQLRDPLQYPKEEELPGLERLIEEWFDEKIEVTHEEFYKRILGVFKKSTHCDVYNEVLGKLPESHQKAINAFVAGDKSADDVSQDLNTTTAQDKKITPEHIIEHPVAHDALSNNTSSSYLTSTELSKVKKRLDYEFQNWGRTVRLTPAITFYPNTIDDVRNIVKESVKEGRGIRVSGFRHSWAPVFGRDNLPHRPNNGDVMISMLTELNAGVLPNFTALPTSLFQPDENQLNHIMKVGPVLENRKQYVRVGAATTNEQFRRWCIKTGKVTLPLNIIEGEITMGGANAPICHGAGIQHATLSDLVRAIEYVDVNGERQKVDMSEPDLLKAAAGCFGLLGVVTHITYECDPIATAVMRPVKIDVIKAIPPPPELEYGDIPEPLRPAKPLTAEERADAQREFERRANNDYYAEWFWFPYSSQVWVNTWSIDTDTTNVVDYPSNLKTVYQVLATALGNIGQNVLKNIPVLTPHQQTTMMTWIAMMNLDEVHEGKDPIRALIPDALHFQRGVTNIRVRDMEVEFPLHAKPSNTQERDYTNVQRAWWDAIIACYNNTHSCPQRMPLEMRIMGGSEVTMAPQRGHDLGTCSIEILTLHAAAEAQPDIWQPYAQHVLDKWMSLKDADGKQLMVRPHWAKEWAKMHVRGKPWREVLKNESYPEQIAEFKKLLTDIGRKQKWTLGDLKRTFSNDLFDYMFFDDIEATPHPTVSLLTAMPWRIGHRRELIDFELVKFRRLFKSLRRKFFG